MGFDNEINLYTINNYHFHANCNNGYQTDEVLILSHKDINCLVSSISFNSADILKMEIEVDKLVLDLVYRLHTSTARNFINDI